MTANNGALLDNQCQLSTQKYKLKNKVVAEILIQDQK